MDAHRPVPTAAASTQDSQPDSPRAGSYRPIHKHCTADEVRLLKALRYFSTDPAGRECAVRILKSMDITGRAISAFARLSLYMSSNTANVRLLGPASPYVTSDELDMIARLGRLSRDDADAEKMLPADAGPFRDTLQRCGSLLKDAGARFPKRSLAPYRSRQARHLPIDPVQPVDRQLREIHVRRVEQISPGIRRVTFHGDALQDVEITGIAQWVKVFVTPEDDVASIGRALTIRRYRAAQSEMTIDFAMHGNGPLSTWAARAHAGATARIAGPRGGYAIDPATDSILLTGDLAALPAIATFIEALPAHVHAQVVVQLDNPDDRHVLPRNERTCVTVIANAQEPAPGTHLLQAIDALNLSMRNVEGWIFAETATAHGVLQGMLRRHASIATAIHSVGYWKAGEAGYKDLCAG
ncbi:siderophore-interacting protein [Burkholderia lata]|nr:siderophore-interacting protein [Burkholderia lata]